MKLPVIATIVAGAALLAVSSARAAPMPPMPPMTIEGTIEEISWSPERHVKGQPGMSGSAGHDRTFPARYRVKLVRTTVAARGDGHIPFRSGEAFSITLDHPKDDGYLEKGMAVRITGFLMFGDEGGIRTRFEKIEVLDKKPVKPVADEKPAKPLAPEDPSQKMRPALERILKALQTNDHDLFPAGVTTEPGTGVTRRSLEEMSAGMAPRLEKGYDISYLGELKQGGFQVHLWKLAHRDGGDDTLVRLVLENGKVSGFRLELE